MTITKPLFSIITVTLNHVSGLQKTYQSIETQTFHDYEWIVIDGASTDGTTEHLKTTRAIWISEKDSGIYDAMNKGIDRANGGYVIFMNAGDCFANNNILLKLAEVIQKENSDFIYGDSLEIFNGESILKKSRPHTKINQGMFTHHQAMIYKKSLLKNYKYNTAYKIAADYDLTLRLLKKTDKISYLSEPICLFESGGISQKRALKGRLEQFTIRQKADLNFIQNALTFIAQTAAYSLRKTMPALYWRLKH